MAAGMLVRAGWAVAGKMLQEEGSRQWADGRGGQDARPPGGRTGSAEFPRGMAAGTRRRKRCKLSARGMAAGILKDFGRSRRGRVEGVVVL